MFLTYNDFPEYKYLLLHSLWTYWFELRSETTNHRTHSVINI